VVLGEWGGTEGRTAGIRAGVFGDPLGQGLSFASGGCVLTLPHGPS
jgi:hypothetical protein